jgi:hypothetical protein
MKTNILLVLLVCTAMVSNVKAQSKQYKYCRLTATEKNTITNNENIISKHEIINVDFGNNVNSYEIKDTSGISIGEKIESITNVIDALNYLSSLGWDYVNTVSPVVGYSRNFTYYMYILRKDITLKD